MAGKTETTMEAIEHVLRHARGPLSTSVIAERVLHRPVNLKGKTPKATIAAKLYLAARDGDTIKQTGRGMFDLASRGSVADATHRRAARAARNAKPKRKATV